MRIERWGGIGTLAAALALAGCGGGGGGGGLGSVSLKTTDDVIREIDNATVAQLLADPGMFVPEGGGAPTAYRVLQGDRTARPGGQKVSPAAAETVPCTTSGAYTVEDFTGEFAYELFAQTLASDSSVAVYDDCVEESGDIRSTVNGRVEVAGTSGTAGTAESPNYFAAVFGSGSTPFRDVLDSLSTSQRFTLRVRGRFEGREAGTLVEARDAVSLDFVASFEGESVSAGLDIGQSDDPLILVEDSSLGTVTIDGPIGYSSEFCDDGWVHYTTLEALHYNGEMGFYDAGQLLIESGGQGVTVTFLGNGDVSYQFANGNSGVIPQADLGSGGGCMVI